MAKRDKNFRLSKTVKRMMAFITDDKERNHFKNMMIDAELSAATLPPKSSKNKKEVS